MMWGRKREKGKRDKELSILKNIVNFRRKEIIGKKQFFPIAPRAEVFCYELLSDYGV